MASLDRINRFAALFLLATILRDKLVIAERIKGIHDDFRLTNDSEVAASEHAGGSKHEEKGGGMELHEDHRDIGEEKADKGYKVFHEFDKGEKGHHDKENHKQQYDEKEGEEEEKHEEADHYDESHHGEKGEKTGEFDEEGKHQKGYSTKGEHSISKK
ncbi:uncharacterized protein LOC144478165, partial [Augochlora pura]